MSASAIAIAKQVIEVSRKYKKISKFKPRVSGMSVSMVFAVLLLVELAYFLISESTKVYIADGTGATPAWFKAILCESMILLFSFMNPERKVLKIAAKGLLVAVCSYMGVVVCFSVICNGYEKSEQIAVNEAKIKIVKDRMESMQKIQSGLIDYDKLSKAYEVKGDLNSLFDQYDELSRIKTRIGSSAVHAKMYAWLLAALRLLAMVAEVLISHIIGLTWRISRQQK